MAKYRTAALAAVCIGIGVLGAVLFGGSGGSPAQAQQFKAPATPGRYQISAYGYGLGSGGPGSRSERGAYILDSQTGDVFVVVSDKAPKHVGSVDKAKKE